tara:strand:+ start:167 stop:1162 length:996 start_codon:yes stop_codon:yes gene_type:complete
MKQIENKVFVIAEAGSNHDGKIEQAKQLIDVAVEAKADAVKFQVFLADTLYSKNAPHLSEMKTKQTPYELLKSLEMPREWIKELAEYCEENGIIFMATPFDLKAVDAINEYVSVYKVSGYDIDNFSLLEKIKESRKPIILSTGTSTIEEVKKAVEVLKNNVILLHCTNQYPTKDEDANVKAMTTLAKLNVPVGLSDHTLGNEAAITAIALGAKVIEKHITIDKTLSGPDHAHAIDPEQLKEFVKVIRTAEKVLGSEEKKPTDSEKENRELARRSIHAKQDISKGETITKDMLILKRPALGIRPIETNKLIGKKVKQDIKEDQWITWEMVGD